MSDFVPIEKYRELEEEIRVLQKTIAELGIERDQSSLETLNFWKKFLKNAGSCDPESVPDLREKTTERFDDKHMTPKEKVDQTPIFINMKVRRLFLTAVQEISGTECDERLTEMYTNGYWLNEKKKGIYERVRKHSTCLGSLILQFESFGKENMQLIIMKYDKKYTPENKKGKLKGKINHFAGQKSEEENINDDFMYNIIQDQYIDDDSLFDYSDVYTYDYIYDYIYDLHSETTNVVETTTDIESENSNQ